MPSSLTSAHARPESASVTHRHQLSAELPSPSLAKRMVRLTFRHKGHGRRSPSFSSLPSSRTSLDTNPLPNTASAPKMVMRHTIVSAPTIAEITSTISVRTSSTAPDTTSVYFSSPPPFTSLPNSSIDGSTDRRSMRRTSKPALSNSIRPRAVSHSSMSTVSTLPEYEKPLPPTPSPKFPSTPHLQTRRPSMVERAAFLSSVPVRSKIPLAPRSKSITPGTLAYAALSSPSLSSFPSATLSVWPKGGHCPLNLEKRRWSNDSTRGFHGAMASSPCVPEFDSFLKRESDAENNGECEDSDDACSSTAPYDYYNDHDNNDKRRSSTKAIKSIEKQKMPMKKRCPTLTLFSFMTKK